MKQIFLISRLLLGIIFVVFGLNLWLKFITVPPPQGEAAAFLGAMYVSGYLAVVKGLEVIGGLLLFNRRTTSLGILILGPIVVNILLFDLFLARAFNPLGAAVAVLSLVVLWSQLGNGVFSRINVRKQPEQFPTPPLPQASGIARGHHVSN